MKKITEITITFENCEWITVKAEDMYYFELFGIETSYTPYDFHQYRMINNFIIGIKDTADLSRSGLQSSDESKNTLERLNYCDVTHIDIEHDDGSTVILHVDWDEPTTPLIDQIFNSQTKSEFQHTKRVGNIALIYQSKNNPIVDQSVELLEAQERADDNF